MRNFCALLVATICLALWHAPSQASSDYGCRPSLKLAHSSLTDCDNIAILGPGNDSRVNLVMLLVDRQGKAPAYGGSNPQEPFEPLFGWRTFGRYFSAQPDEEALDMFAEGEGSRCRSNMSGTQAFEAAIKSARKLGAGEGELLIGVRRAMQPTCAGKTPGDKEISEIAGAIQSRDGRAFEAYLRGTIAFYDGDFDAAASHFRSLRNASLPWIEETARYMLARVEVNRAQLNAFDEYGSSLGPDHVDHKVIDDAEAALFLYIREHPRGLYTKSARGLLRRVYWLGGRTDKLAAQYVSLFAQDPEARGISDAELAQEIDNKLLPELNGGRAIDPILLAVADLMRMRPCEGCSRPQITLAELEAQRGNFSAEPALFDYLLAAHAFHVSNRAEQVLLLLPEVAPRKSHTYLEFSRQMLRGMALEKLGRANSGTWRTLLTGATLPWQREALELAIALHDERGDALASLFEAGSPVQIPVLRETLLINVADAALLRARAKDANARPHERDVALFTLLYKELSRGAYRDFLGDLALVPVDAAPEGGYYDLVSTERIPLGIFTAARVGQDFDCPPLRQTAMRLSTDPGNVHGHLCIADFMRVNGFDHSELDQQPPKDELGGTASLFRARPYARLEVYKRIMAEPKATPSEKAYALYRAVNCYGPTGSNSCGGTEVPISQRRAWFNRLKKDYPATPWAKALKYYW